MSQQVRHMYLAINITYNIFVLDQQSNNHTNHFWHTIQHVVNTYEYIYKEL